MTGDYTDNGLPFLSDSDRAEWIDGSAIRAEVLEAQRPITIQDKRDLPRFGFQAANGRVPCLLIPRHTISGEVVYTVKPRASLGAEAKYYHAKDSRVVINVNPLAVPDVMNADIPLWITEGVKKSCSAVSHGLACVDIGGVHSWKEKDGTALADWYKIPLKGRTVYLAFDHDAKPQTRITVHFAMLKLAKFLKAQKAEVHFVYLPLGPNGEKTGIDDYFVRGGTVKELKALAEPELRPLFPEGIETTDRHLSDIGEDALGALGQHNDPPRLFIRAGDLCRKKCDERKNLMISPVASDAIQGELARASKWFSTSEKRGAVPVFPSRTIADYVLTATEYPDAIPPLAGIVGAPVFAPDGTLQTETGYHAATRLYYHSLDPRPIPDTTPTQKNVEAAKNLLKELTIDFPFADDASRAHALAFLLLPFVRSMIDGNTPLHLFEAPKSSTGKSLLCETLANVFCGKVAMQTAPGMNEEMGKTLFASLLAGDSHIIFDNANNLNFPKFHGAITSSEYKDRELGFSKNVAVAQAVVWGATANNLRTNDELTSRTVLIRLDAGVENPDERKGFRHPDLPRWAKENRPALIGAALTLCRAWIEAGKPAYTGSERIERFSAWAQVIGGILEHIGVPGLLANRAQHKQASDSDGAAWRGLVGAWYDLHGGAELTSAKLFDAGIPQEWIADKLGGGEPASQKIKFGKMLREQTDRIHDGLKITKCGEVKSGNQKGMTLYVLVPLEKVGESENRGESQE